LLRDEEGMIGGMSVEVTALAVNNREVGDDEYCHVRQDSTL
jgi:hypothetical protein